MSYEAYVNHILEKHRLAISIAIIKTKPENITIEEHIQQIRNMIKRDDIEADNHSVCNDDFFIDDFDMNIDNNDRNDDPFAQMTDANDYCTINAVKNNNTQDNRTNIRENNEITAIPESGNIGIDHENETNDVEMIDSEFLNDSVTILENFDVASKLDEINYTVGKERESFGNVIDVLKGIDVDITTIDKAVSNKIPPELTQEILLTQPSERLDDTQCLTDIDATQCESLDVVEAVDENILSEKGSYNFNGRKQRVKRQKEQEADDTELLVDFKKINAKKVETSNNVGCHSFKSNVGAKSQNVTIENSSDLENRLKNVDNRTQNLKNYRHTKDFKKIYKNVADIFSNKNNENISDNLSSNKMKTLDKLKDVKNSQDSNTQLINKYNTEDFTCKTHYSQSQINDIIPIGDKYIYGTKRNIYKQNKDVNDTKKKKKEDIIVLEDELIQNSKKDFTEPKDISNDDDISLPKIYLTKASTEKAAIDQKLNTDNEKLLNEAETKTTVAYVFQQESQTTNFSSQTYGNAIFTQNNEDTFENIQDKNAISNVVNANNDTENANNSTSYNNDSMLNANSISLKTNELNETIQDLGSILNLNANNQNVKSKIKRIDKDLFSDESQFANISPTDTYISDISLGFSHNFGTKNCKRDKETESKSCAVLDKILDNTLTDELQTNFSNPKIQKPVKNKETDTPENQKSYTFNSVETTEHKNVATDHCTNSDDDLEELTDPEAEAIPFKIIEELNKVKLFLSKRKDKNLSSKGYSSDTGYRSDCSSRHSLKLSQTSTSGLDQSAHSLYNYISECPLISSTQDITEEISLVLGEFIDKSHEEEKIPSILEDMLLSIQHLLGEIYQDNGEENMLTTKDEHINRIILLNKSIHIQKYTIEKITHTLETLHTELTTNESFEMQNISQIENACYIFHLLEVILRKHNRTSQNLSQTTQSTENLSQNTQEDEKSLKKSNIMDIWRKKWNPNNKEIEIEGSQEKKCVLANCSSVLNKLIVGCMEGYSLISYCALKCFNMMQT